MQHHQIIHFILDAAQMLAVILSGAAIAMACLGIWNGYLMQFVTDTEAPGSRESFLRQLRRIFLVRVSDFNERQFSRKHLDKITATIVIAGDPDDLTAPEFIGLQELSVTLFTLFAAALVFSLELRWIWALGFVVLGWYLPVLWLRDQVTKRHHSITRALPYNLDLLTLSVEAGLDFAQAVGKVVEKGRQGPMVEEFRLVLRNIKLGKTREEALRMMSDRVQLPSLTSFANSLIQADRMGTSLGKVLRIQATQLRIERTNRAEKLANEAPVKMLFPLIACIFPTVFMVLFGPIIYQVMITTK
jgi:tight adherence protein C